MARCDTEQCGRAVNASVYRSKLDSWLLLIFAGAGLVGCYAAWRVAHMPGFAGLFFGLAVLSLAVVLPAWTVRSTRVMRAAARRCRSIGCASNMTAAARS